MLIEGQWTFLRVFFLVDFLRAFGRKWTILRAFLGKGYFFARYLGKSDYFGLNCGPFWTLLDHGGMLSPPSHPPPLATVMAVQ